MAIPGNRSGLGLTEQQRGHGAGQGSKAEEHSEGVLSTIKDKASELASGVAGTAEHAWDATKNVASTVASTAEDAWQGMTNFMRRYPMATFGAGCGLGFLLAMVLLPRRA